MRRSSRFAVCWILLSCPGLLGATEVCDSLAELADAWDELAGAADSAAAGELDDEAVAEIDAAVDESIPPTRDVGKALSDPSDPAVAALARQLLADLATLERTQTFEDAVAAIDQLVGSLDELVAECDARSGGGTRAGGASEDAGQVAITYQAPADPAMGELAQAVADSGLFEEVAGLVGDVLVLPSDLPATFGSCGQPNAFWDPAAGRITMCWEFFALFDQIFSDLASEERFQAVLDTGAFFFLHEVGHALVDLLDVPITGREEDAVDGLAALIMIQEAGPEAMIAVLGNFDALAGLEAEDELAFWDEHSLNAQRLYDMACLLYGSDPEGHAHLVGDDLLPPDRAERCPAEYEAKDRAWDQLLSPFYAE